MKRSILVVAVLVLSVSLFSTVGAERAGAQGPAGAGASSAAQGSSKSSDSKGGHSLNPIKWVKKDKGSKSSAERQPERYRKEADAETAGSGCSAGKCQRHRRMRTIHRAQ